MNQAVVNQNLMVQVPQSVLRPTDISHSSSLKPVQLIDFPSRNRLLLPTFIIQTVNAK